MVPIYVKSCYSFLSSIITIDDLILFAQKKHSEYLCLCDDNMYGVMEFIQKCELNSIKPIVGLDLDICLLYAKNYQGYQNLLHLETIKSERNVTTSDLVKYQENLVCFVSEEEPLLEEIKKIYNDIYIYGDNHLLLNKTLCLDENDLEILKYLHLLRDNKTIASEYEISNDVCYKRMDNFDYQTFFQKFDLKLPKYTLNLPDYCKFNDTKGLNSDDYLESLSIIGLNKRLNNKIPLSYKERLLYELSVIKKMGFSNYFLIVYDYIKYAKSHDILVGPGRGSAAGSLVSFSLGITEVDPLKYDLLFERFLNPERVTMPDIDTDFPFDKRDMVIDYVIKKYGEKNVSLITTFVPFGSKMSLRDMGRIMNIPLYMIDDLCKKIGDKSLLDVKNNQYLMGIIESDIKLKKLFEVASRIEGIPRHASIHAAGVIMANTPLDNIVPLVYSDGKYLSGYEAMYLENLGLLKMDFLGIKNLTIISETLNLIHEYEGKEIKFNDIPLSDDKTNKLFSDGDTLGIFQFESAGIREFLKRLKPRSFEDIYNANAFYRPGPSNNITSFINRRNNLEKVDYFDSRLEKILQSTKGIIVYQEQIMQIASVMADFSLGEADTLRRAMSKKKIHDIEKFKDKFIHNSVKNGYNEDLCYKIFDLILNFASYGFNKSHSVAYSMISYKMAYLKVNYPKYFYLSLLNSFDGDEKKTMSYLKEMKKYDIKVNKPDINKSKDVYTIYYNNIILPFNVIKGISGVIARKIVEIRKNGFTDIYDFFAKTTSLLPKNIVESLILSGALDSFGFNRKTLYENIDGLINYGELVKNLGSDYVLKPEMNLQDEYSRRELTSQEKKCFGFYLTNHPVTFVKSKIDHVINLCDLSKYFNKLVKVVVMIDYIKETNTKKGERMAFFECSDEEEKIDVIIFPKLYQELPNLVKNDIIIIEGKVERRNANYNLVANKVIKVEDL